ncbi:MAG: FkbM family methyltransferase [Planctomycetes bacterium]|nr:FkbM family methyltransferase [Planctomycetota bacterium]
MAGSLFQKINNLRQFDNFGQLLLERLFCRRTKVQVYRFGKFEAIVDHRAADAGSIVGCIAGDMYKRFLSRVRIPARAAIADLGANVGGFSLLLLSQGYDIAKLLCVEMNPRTYERLRFNVRNNFAIDAAVINAAVCADERVIECDFGPGSTGDNIYGDIDKADTRYRRSVQGRTLDALIDEHLGDGIIDLCKIDIEGAESEVLLSGKPAIDALTRCRYLFMEMHRQADYQPMLRVLAEHGLRPIADEGKVDCGVHLFENQKLTSTSSAAS